MNCCDSPFDSIWQGTNDDPFFDLRRFKAVLNDWNGLFQTNTIYIGVPIEFSEDASAFRERLVEYMVGSDYIFVVNTPRQTMKTMIEDIAKLEIE